MDTWHTACMGVFVSVIEESFCMNSLSVHISPIPGGLQVYLQKIQTKQQHVQTPKKNLQFHFTENKTD